MNNPYQKIKYEILLLMVIPKLMYPFLGEYTSGIQKLVKVPLITSKILNILGYLSC